MNGHEEIARRLLQCTGLHDGVKIMSEGNYRPKTAMEVAKKLGFGRIVRTFHERTSTTRSMWGNDQLVSPKEGQEAEPTADIDNGEFTEPESEGRSENDEEWMIAIFTPDVMLV